MFIFNKMRYYYRPNLRWWNQLRFHSIFTMAFVFTLHVAIVTSINTGIGVFSHTVSSWRSSLCLQPFWCQLSVLACRISSADTTLHQGSGHGRHHSSITAVTTVDPVSLATGGWSQPRTVWATLPARTLWSLAHMTSSRRERGRPRRTQFRKSRSIPTGSTTLT